MIKAGELLLPVASIEEVDLAEGARGRVRVRHSGGPIAWAIGVDAHDLVMRLHPSALEGRRLRWVRHAWAIHNLVGHPLMQLLVWLGQPKLALAVHDRTVPRPRLS